MHVSQDSTPRWLASSVSCVMLRHSPSPVRLDRIAWIELVSAGDWMACEKVVVGKHVTCLLVG